MSEQERLQEIKNRLENTTPGEWEYFHDSGAIWVKNTYPTIRVREDGYGSEEDGQFMANAHQDIPWLIEQLESALRAQQEQENPKLLSNLQALFEKWEHDPDKLSDLLIKTYATDGGHIYHRLPFHLGIEFDSITAFKRLREWFLAAHEPKGEHHE